MLCVTKSHIAKSHLAVMAFAGATVLSGCATHHGMTSSTGAAAAGSELNVTAINGERPPGRLERLVDAKTMLDTIDVNGKRMLVERGVRKPGTRVAIHVHQFGGHTCVMSGEITDFMEGHPPSKWPAGTCYYTPPNVLMTAANLGTQDAVLIDTFILPLGSPAITIREPGYPTK